MNKFILILFFVFVVLVTAANLTAQEYIYLISESGDTLSRVSISEEESKLLKDRTTLDSFQSIVIDLVKDVPWDKEESTGTNLSKVMLYVLELILAGGLASVLTRVNKVLSILRPLFKDFKSRDVVTLISFGLAIIVTAFMGGVTLGGVVVYGIVIRTIAVVLYEKGLKKVFGKTPKEVEVEEADTKVPTSSD